MVDIFQKIRDDIRCVSNQLLPKDFNWDSFILDFPKNSSHGDLYTNIALVVSKKAMSIAFKIKDCLETIEYISSVNVVKPGFINIILRTYIWQRYLSLLLEHNHEFWFPNLGKGVNVNIEYVSANPTGPLHIGHTRCAIYGHVLSNLLTVLGYNVTKEYYINDYGSQVDNLINTVLLRCKEIISGKILQISSDMYPGEYLKDIAKDLVKKYDKDQLFSSHTIQKIRSYTISRIMSLIQEDLALLGVQFDVFTSEQDLHDRGLVESTLAMVKDLGFLYEGTLDLPKSDSAKYLESREQTLFKSSLFGDAQDRPVRKHDGTWTYFASDFAYTKDKIDRGFDILVYILGTDHKGYITRIKALVEVLGRGKINSIVQTNELVNFVRDDISIKMSKRSGNILSVSDVVRRVGLSALRFMMISKKNDLVIDFDFEKLLEQNKNNPVFYVQYAYVRIISVMRNAGSSKAMTLFRENKFDLSLLSSEEEIAIIKLLVSWPRLIKNVSVSFELHKIVNYLLDIVSKFHFLWNLGKIKNNYLFITDNNELTSARLAFIEAIRMVIYQCFMIIGIQPLEEM